MGKDKDNYNEIVSLQNDNHENKGRTKNQNEVHNIKKEALGPNTRRK